MLNKLTLPLVTAPYSPPSTTAPLRFTCLQRKRGEPTPASAPTLFSRTASASTEKLRSELNRGFITTTRDFVPFFTTSTPYSRPGSVRKSVLSSCAGSAAKAYVSTTRPVIAVTQRVAPPTSAVITCWCMWAVASVTTSGTAFSSGPRHTCILSITMPNSVLTTLDAWALRSATPSVPSRSNEQTQTEK